MKISLKLMAFAAAAALVAPSIALADPVSNVISSLPGSHVCHLSLIDHPDIPNATVLGPNEAPCETVLVLPASSSLGSKPCKKHGA